MPKARSALDLVRSEVQKLTGAKKRQVSTGLIEGNANDSLQRFKRGRKAFGSRIESRFVAASAAGNQCLATMDHARNRSSCPTCCGLI